MSNLKTKKKNVYRQAILTLLREVDHAGVKAATALLPDATENERRIVEKAIELFTGARETNDAGLLRPVFDVIFSSEETNQKASHSFYFQPQSINNLPFDLFPVEGDVPNNSELSWENLANDLKKLNDLQNGQPDPDTLLSLLFIHTSTLPEPSGAYPGVSFFDYAKIVSGVAICLLEYSDHSSINEIDDSSPAFRLVRADMSGIQDFLFEIASKHAAKNLKGRSFYIRLLGETILTRLLTTLEIFQANLIYNSGGNFLMLAPNVKKVTQELDPMNPDSLLYELTKNLFDHHGATLSAVIGSVPITPGELKGAPLGNVIDSLFERIDQAKKQKFSNLLANDFEQFFDEKKVGDQGATTLRDALTGEEIGFNETAFYQTEDGAWRTGKSDDPEVDQFKEATKKQIDLGKNLRNTDYWVISRENIPALSEDPRLSELIHQPVGLGVYHYLIPGNAKDIYDKFRQAFRATNFALTIYEFNEANFLTNDLPFGSQHSYGMALYAGNKVPEFEYAFTDKDTGESGKAIQYQPGDPKTFNHLAYKLAKEKDKEAVAVSKIKRLGVLRMDVDGLGWLFSEGIHPSLLSLPMQASLSRHLDTFFMGLLNRIWDGDEDFCHYSQIIYAGGDDLFIVGRWDTCINFAETIQSKFREWTCQVHQPGPPRLSISGGVAIVNHKFPIIKGAEFADDAEKEAKEYKINPPGNGSPEIVKNAFTLWRPMNWDTDFPALKGLKNRVLEFLTHDKIHKSFFFKLNGYYENKLYAEHQGQTPQWRWQIAYDIARTQEAYAKKSGDVFKAFHVFLEEIKTDIFCDTFGGTKNKLNGNYTYFDLLNMAIRWAELESRTNPKSKNDI